MGYGGTPQAPGMLSALEALAPTGNSSLPPVTINASSVNGTLAANTVFVDFMLTGVAARVICADSTPTAGRGAIYQPNILYRLPACGKEKIYAERTSATAGTLNVTCYCKG